MNLLCFHFSNDDTEWIISHVTYLSVRVSLVIWLWKGQKLGDKLVSGSNDDAHDCCTLLFDKGSNLLIVIIR